METQEVHRLELGPPELKVTYMALKSFLDDFGHDEYDVQRLVRSVIEKLPPSEQIEAIDSGAAAQPPAPLGPGRRAGTASVVVPPASDRAAGGADDPQHGTDDDQDDPDRVEDADAQQQAEQEQHDSGDDQWGLRLLTAAFFPGTAARQAGR